MNTEEAAYCPDPGDTGTLGIVRRHCNVYSVAKVDSWHSCVDPELDFDY